MLDKYCLCRRTIALPLCVNCSLAPLTNSWLLVQSYSKTSKRSRGHNHLSTVSGVAAKVRKAGVTSANALHMSHAVRLPLFPKHDTMSQLVKASTIGKVTQWSGPSALAISSAGKYRKFFRAPNAIHSSVMLRRWADVTARTTTSVLTVRMGILSYPCVTVSTTWNTIRVSASS